MNLAIPVIIIYFAISGFLCAQNRFVTRGAEQGELYMTGTWYGIYDPEWGPPFFDTARTAVYHLTEHGKKLTIQYDADYFADSYTEPGSVMQAQYILADATPGVVYSKNIYYKNDYSYTSLWVSFDYGENWIFREEKAYAAYYSGIYNNDGNPVIYRGGGGVYFSLDFGQTWTNIENTGHTESGDIGYRECEFLGLSLNSFYYTQSCFNTYTTIEIDSLFIFGQMGGLFPDAYRGGEEGEVYISSWFPDWSYKVSFSSDTGQTFRHVYVCENCDPHADYESHSTSFMSDREQGVFYILRSRTVIDSDNSGEHQELCIEYYRDYGQVLEATFYHDLTKDYEYKEAVCENTTSLESKMVNHNSVQLQWTSSADNSQIRGYHVYRNNVRITGTLLNETGYCDANLPAGEYEYYVKTYYMADCLPDGSNRINEMVTLGSVNINNVDKITIYPNPTKGELRVENKKLRVESVQIFDVFGKAVGMYGNTLIDVSHLPAGVYFVQITTENRTVIKKIIKY